MSDTPPVGEPSEPEYPAEPPQSGDRPAGRFPVMPVAFATGGLVLGVAATVLISSLGGSHKSTSVAAAVSQKSPGAISTLSGPAPAAHTSGAARNKPSSSARAASDGLPPADEAGLAHSAPTAVEIPKIGVNSNLVGLDLAGDGTLQVPTDFSKAGWYASGAYPGDANEPPALIVGHVDNYKGPAIFYRLKELGVGDKVLVPRADGTTATFVVYRSQNYLKSSFPARSVYAATGRPELRLITCTGQFDSNARSYLSNFVAFAYLASGGR